MTSKIPEICQTASITYVAGERIPDLYGETMGDAKKIL